MSPKVWFVTGSSSGLGLSVVKHVLSKGDIAIATLRKPELLADLKSQHDPSKLLVLKLDVSKPDEIISAFSAALDKFGRIDVVYNNAGHGFLSEFESSPDDIARSMFEVNFWGAANVSRETIRIFRDVNKPSGGRLIQASSGVGVTGMPAISYYSASKFAIAGLTESISKELDPSWNIKVVILDIGSYRTNGIDALAVVPQHPQYANTATTYMRKNLLGKLIPFGDPTKAAREIYRIAGDDDAPLRVALGLDTVELTKGRIDDMTRDVEKSAVYCADLM